MSSAFQLSSAYRPYRSPLSESSTIVAGMAIRTTATSSLPRPAVGEPSRVTDEQRSATPAARSERGDRRRMAA